MKLLRLAYWDLYSGFSIDCFDLHTDLNLLVGISGSGKTSILKAINNLKRIANGESLNGIKWDVEFLASHNVEFLTNQNTNFLANHNAEFLTSNDVEFLTSNDVEFLTNNDDHYRWQGEFDIKKDDGIVSIENFQIYKFKIITEYLYKNDIEIIRVEQGRTFLHQKEIPKMSNSVSVVELLNSQEDLGIVKLELNKINTSFIEYIERPTFFLFNNESENLSKYTLETIREDNFDLRLQWLLLCKNKPEIFLGIKQSFTTLFPQVEDLEIEFVPDPEERFSPLSAKVVQIKIKEKHCERWILEKNIASGMLRTFIFLSLIELAPDGSVILIDEFDNSLGVNCLDILTEILSDSYKERDLQFIITSHHPYIIDNISPAYWKIITRKNGVITASNAENYHIAKTHQNAVVALMAVLKNFPEGR